MDNSNIADFVQAKRLAQKDSPETLFERAYNLAQRIGLLRSISYRMHEVCDTVVYSAVTIIDNSGMYLELEKSHGGVRINVQDIQEPLFGYKSHLRDSLNSDNSDEEELALETLLEEEQEKTDIHGRKFLVCNPSVRHVLAYSSSQKGEMIRYTQILDKEEVFEVNLFPDGTAKITNYEIQETVDELNSTDNEEINDFFDEMSEWTNKNM